MNPQHHLDPATLVGYASGGLPVGLAVVAAAHLEVCGDCRSKLRDAESIGGALLEQQQPEAAEPLHFSRLRQDMLARLESAVPEAACNPFDRAAQPDSNDPDLLPKPLCPYFGSTWRELEWKWVAPGIHRVRAKGVPKDSLFMLKIAPGKSMPVHSHAGSELTQILRGAYDDKLGHFAPGDIADLDSEVEHQPVTAPGVPCVCVAALDAPLRFRGWLARKLQPLVGM